MEAKPDLKSMSTSQKLGYIWDYYKFHIMGVIVLAVTLLSIIHHYATVKTSVLDMLFLNANTIENEMLPFEDFLSVKGFNLNKQEVRVTTSIGFTLEGNTYQEDFYSLQTISALFGAGDLDIFAAPHQVFDDFASAGYVSNLAFIFSEEELASFGDKIIYTTSLETGKSFPSGFYLENNDWLEESGYYTNVCCIAATACTDSPELVRDFLLYILN